eukprot:UC4_evm7s575
MSCGPKLLNIITISIVVSLIPPIRGRAQRHQVFKNIEIHVHPSLGDDKNSGVSPESPLATLGSAVRLLRELRQITGQVQNEFHDTTIEIRGAATVYLHEGTHEPLYLDPSLDSGTKDFHIRYTSYPGANATISAGIEIEASLWKPWNNHPSIITASLSKLGLSDFGSLPTAGAAIDQCDQLTYNKTQAMVLARYPNLAPNGDWIFLHAGDTTDDGFTLPSGNEASRVSSWKNEESPFLHGYWQWDWADSITAIKNVTSKLNGDTKIITGQSAKKNARFFGLNLLSELDSTNEFYIDTSPPSSWVSNPSVSVHEVAVNFDGTSHVTLENVTVAHAKMTCISAVGKNCADKKVGYGQTVFGCGGNGVTISDAIQSGISESEQLIRGMAKIFIFNSVSTE